MNPLYVFWLLILGDDVCSFKPDYSVKRESKSIFSNKKHIETIMPARYQVGNRNIKHDRTADNFMPKQFFPEVDYPTNIIESSKPFYYRAEENNAIFTHFPNDVRANFKSLITQPALGKVNSKVNTNVVSQYKTQPKILITPKNKAMSATVSNITDNSAAVDLSTTFIDDELVELILDDRNVVMEPVLEYEKTMDTVTINKENSTSDKMMSPESESMESYEYMDDAECSQNCSMENITTEIVYYDHIEVFDDDLNVTYTNTSFEVTIPIETEMVFHNDSELRNSSLLQSDKLTEDTKKLMEPEIIQTKLLPNEQKESYIIKNAPMQLRLGSAPNMKRKKFLTKIHKSPINL